ncbi:hypothetical protein A8C75_19470 [Marinobacterium aestuarii]|uniref:CYTH domain-containing protein n=1 Tax=Marinobacterium aestuarii TaxID=1821621 RepID=A0A1A9F2P2_9GAMM|nr:CYTH domain-containing protein [Marinobacterium aestuarii]ANG64435.1 hypothetical protein A8C75_19470 [Marinobacterium aestuarii]
MYDETEIKLRVSEQTMNDLRRHPLIIARLCGDWTGGVIYNQYYDSVDRRLNDARVALRMRRDGDQCIQTLKTRGQSVAGLSVRTEWDWYYDAPQLDLSVLDAACWPAQLNDLDKTRLLPVFTTDFSRSRARLLWDYRGQPVEVEVALDQGKVVAGSREEVICEVELEIRQGPVEALLELACDLAAELPLMPCDISKSERGYRLFDAASYELKPALPDWTPITRVDCVMADAGWYLLGYIQRLAEQYRFARDPALLRDLSVQLLQLRAFFLLFDRIISRHSVEGLLPPLVRLTDALQSGDDPALFDARVADPQWGQLFLNLAAWLHREDWKAGRTSVANGQGSLTFGGWLRDSEPAAGANIADSQHLLQQWLRRTAGI